MLWTTDEEVGSATSRAAIEDEARRSDAVLVLEPSLPGGAVKTARKGCGEYELRVRGVAAHAGIDPSKGASAIHELARQIVARAEASGPRSGRLGQRRHISGGTRTNVVAEEARAVVDVRAPTQADAARCGRGVPRAEGRGRPDDRIRDRRLRIVRRWNEPPRWRVCTMQACEVARELGQALGEGGTGGGSDGNFTAALGCSDIRRPRCGRRRRARAARARRHRVVADRAALVAGLDRKDRIAISHQLSAISLRDVAERAIADS